MKSLFAYFASLSRGQRRFLTALGILVVLPFTTLMGLQIHNAAALAMLSNRIAVQSDSWKSDALALNAQVAPESLESTANQYAYKLVARHGELMPERRVVATIQLPLADPRNRKDKSLRDDLLNRAAEKIQALGDDECALLTGTLAAQCTVMSATGRPAGEDAYEYQFQLAFAEKHTFGKADPAARYEFLVSRSSPGKAATRERIYFEKAARQRQRIYQDVADTCAAIRRKSGNCSVTALSVASRLDRGTPMARISASASYGSLVKIRELAASTR